MNKMNVHFLGGSIQSYTQPSPRPGFLRAVLLTLKLKEKAVMICGPPCGSFVFINMHTSGRRKDRPLGLASLRSYVRVANVNLDGISFPVIAYWTHQIGSITFLIFAPMMTGFPESKDNNSDGALMDFSNSQICVRGCRTTWKFSDAMLSIFGLLQEDCVQVLSVVPGSIVRGSSLWIWAAWFSTHQNFQCLWDLCASFLILLA